MPWPQRRRRHYGPLRLQNPNIFPLRTDVPASTLTPNHFSGIPINSVAIEPTTPFLPSPEDVPVLSPTNEQAALSQTVRGLSQYGNDLGGFPNEHLFNFPKAKAVYPQQFLTSNEPYRSNEPTVLAGILQASQDLPFRYPSQTQPWANIPGDTIGIGVPTLSRNIYAQPSVSPYDGVFQSSPVLDPGLSHGLGPGGFSHSSNIQSHSPEMATFPRGSGLTQQNVSSLASRYGGPHIAPSLDLADAIEKEVRITMTREDGSQVVVTARPTCDFDYIYIPRRIATQCSLMIRPIALPRRKQQLTPNGYETPVDYVQFNIESKAYDIHRTPVSAMVLEDSSNNLTAICLGLNFLQKVYGQKLKMGRPSKILRDTVGSNSMVSYTMAQVDTAGNVHHPYANSRDMGRLATATEPQPFISSSPISPVPTNTQSFLYPSTVSYSGGYSYSGYPSTMLSGAFSEPSATTGITAPSSVEDDNESTPKPHTSALDTGQLGPPSNGTINPLMLTSDNGNGSSSTNEASYTASQLLSGQDDPYDYDHPRSGTNVPYIRLN